jgi:hypothetical protein
MAPCPRLSSRATRHGLPVLVAVDAKLHLVGVVQRQCVDLAVFSRRRDRHPFAAGIMLFKAASKSADWVSGSASGCRELPACPGEISSRNEDRAA